jgi:hypothetical protein
MTEFASEAGSEFLCTIWITTLWPSWLRHCATSRKVAGSNFHWYNFSGRSGVDSAYNRNEYQEYFLGGKGGLCLGLTTLPPTCDDCLEIYELDPRWTLWACQGLYRDGFTFDMDKRSPSNGNCSKKNWFKKFSDARNYAGVRRGAIFYNNKYNSTSKYDTNLKIQTKYLCSLSRYICLHSASNHKSMRLWITPQGTGDTMLEYQSLVPLQQESLSKPQIILYCYSQDWKIVVRFAARTWILRFLSTVQTG